MYLKEKATVKNTKNYDLYWDIIGALQQYVAELLPNPAHQNWCWLRWAWMVHNNNFGLPFMHVFYSFETGTGKSTLGEIIAATMKPYAVATKGSAVFKNFNAIIVDKFYVCVHETVGQNSASAYENLKTLCTEPTATIEPKGVDSHPQANFLNIDLFTNNIVKISLTADERRIIIFECAKVRPQTVTKLYDLLQAKAGLDFIRRENATAFIKGYLKHEIYDKLNMDSWTWNNWLDKREEMPDSEAHNSRLERANVIENFLFWINQFKTTRRLIDQLDKALITQNIEDYEDYEGELKFTADEWWLIFEAYKEHARLRFDQNIAQLDGLTFIPQMRKYLKKHKIDFTSKQSRIKKGKGTRSYFYTLTFEQIDYIFRKKHTESDQPTPVERWQTNNW
jgi:hypothetical protein